MYVQYGMGVSVKGVDCGVEKWVKHDMLKWFGHVMRMRENGFF